MDLPREQEQRYEEQASVVRGLRNEGYSREQVLGLSNVKELNLDRETVGEIWDSDEENIRRSLASEGAGKEAFREMGREYFDKLANRARKVVRPIKHYLESSLTPFSLRRNLVEKNPDYSWIWGTGGPPSPALWGISNFFNFVALSVTDNVEKAPYYFAAVAVANALNGGYELGRKKWNKVKGDWEGRRDGISEGRYEDSKASSLEEIAGGSGNSELVD